MIAEFAYGIAVGPNDNIYIVGAAEDQAEFGSNKLSAQGLVDGYIAKLDNTGKWLWAKSLGASSFDAVTSVATDSKGNVLVGGFFSGKISFGTTSFEAKGNGDLFVAQISAEGQWIWAKAAASDTTSVQSGVEALAVDKSDNVLITGRFYGQTMFGSTALNSAGNGDVFVSKLDSQGQWLWAQKASSPEQVEGKAIAVDASGHIYVAGALEGNTTFGSTTLSKSGKREAFVAKLSPSGDWVWAQATQGAGFTRATDVAVTADGVVYIGGTFQGKTSFGSTALTASATGELSNDVFVWKLAP